MSYWTKYLRHWFSSQIPDDYLAFDYETTGVVTDDDLPIEFGYTLVRDRKIVNQQSFMLNWTKYPDLVDSDWLYDQLKKLKYFYGLKGLPYNFSVERLRKYGKDPFKVLKFNYDIFAKNRAAGAGFVGHNAAAFDCALSKAVLLEYINKEWEWGDNEVFDTGSMEKVLECVRTLEPAKWIMPKKKEPLFKFFLRAAGCHRKGVLWNILKCVERYNYVDRFGIKVADLHGAMADSNVCHLLVEDYRNGRFDNIPLAEGYRGSKHGKE